MRLLTFEDFIELGIRAKIPHCIKTSVHAMARANVPTT
jgi:hypothetical protein